MQNQFEALRQRSRKQWEALARETVTDFRIWIQENPEKGFVAGILAGLIFALAFRVILVLLLVGLGTLAAFWYFAPHDDNPVGVSKNGSDSSPNEPTVN